MSLKVDVNSGSQTCIHAYKRAVEKLETYGGQNGYLGVEIAVKQFA